LRKVFGPMQNKDGSWKIRKNYELNKLIENADVLRFIKSGRIAWLGHVMRVDDKRTPKIRLEWKPLVTRIRGKPRKRWIADIEEDMQIMGINGGETNVKKEPNRRKSLRRLKPIVGCSAGKRRRSVLEFPLFYFKGQFTEGSKFFF